VSLDNGVGLSADMTLLEGMLTGAGYEVRRVDWRKVAMPRCDIAIFLELWSPRLAQYAGRTVGVFNLEWFQSSWGRDLPKITQLWAKSTESYAAYQRLRLHNATLTGFLSRDLRDESVQREPVALHLRGHSDFKNTDTVIEAWRRDPRLPPLTIVSAVPLAVPPYVRVLGRISDEELRAEMNRAAIHVCPSRAEGWGHYITEALSVGALVVTTDASPMNEHVTSDWGALVTPSATGRHGLVTAHGVSARQLAEKVRTAAAVPAIWRTEMSRKARAHFEARNASFTETALSLLARI
jgi:glycosyltransferase involved in cell wall biosynthesis